MKQCDQTFQDIIQEGTLSHDRRFSTVMHPRGWISFAASYEENLPQVGWKAHIGIDDSDVNNLARGWEAMLPIFQKYNILGGKIIRPGTQGTPLSINSALQCGKQVVIFCNKNMEVGGQFTVDWAAFFTEITQALRVAGVNPAPPPPQDLQIPGTEYITYRNDKGADGQYDRNMVYDPAIHDNNPFVGFHIHAQGDVRQRPTFPMQAAPESNIGQTLGQN